jgi:hypothetical protein
LEETKLAEQAKEKADMLEKLKKPVEEEQKTPLVFSKEEPVEKVVTPLEQPKMEVDQPMSQS